MNRKEEEKLTVPILNYKRRSWHGQLTKVVTPRKFNDIFLFDIDADYDVPPTPKAVEVETYDFPNPSETVSNQVLYKGVSPVLMNARKLLDELLSTEIVQAKALNDFIQFANKTLKQIETLDLIEKLRVYLQVLIESNEQLSINRENNEHDPKQISNRIQDNASGFVNILSCNYDLLFMSDDHDYDHDNWLNDYSYIHLTLDSRSKLNDFKNAEKFDDNEGRMLICLTSQIASYAKQVTESIDVFLQAIATNQVPKQFVEKAKHVMVQCSRVIYVTDQIIRNLHNDSLRGIKSLLKRTNDRLSKTVLQFCEKTKIAIDKFPNIAAVQDMVDAIVDVSHTVSNSKLVLYKQVQSLRQTLKT